MSSVAHIHPPAPLTTLQLVDTRQPHYQKLKARVHQELLNRLNLERLTRTKREDAEPEIRQIIVAMLEKESATTPLSLHEREAVIGDVVNELFGLGPLEQLLKDPTISDILVNRFDRVYIEREGRLEETDIVFTDERHLLADHRTHRQQCGPSYRRVESDGGCPSC